MNVTIDFETRSEVNLKKVGLSRYAKDPTTRVLCMAYQFEGDDTPRVWVPGEPFPFDDPSNLIFHAHNAAFEMAIWNDTCTRLYGWPEIVDDLEI